MEQGALEVPSCVLAALQSAAAGEWTAVVSVGETFPVNDLLVRSTLRHLALWPPVSPAAGVLALSVTFEAGCEEDAEPGQMLVTNRGWLRQQTLPTRGPPVVVRHAAAVANWASPAQLEQLPAACASAIVFGARTWCYFGARLACVAAYARLLRPGGRLVLPGHDLLLQTALTDAAARAHQRFLYLPIDRAVAAAGAALDLLRDHAATTLVARLDCVRGALGGRLPAHYQVLADLVRHLVTERKHSGEPDVPRATGLRCAPAASEAEARERPTLMYAFALYGLPLHEVGNNSAFAVPLLGVLAHALAALELLWDTSQCATTITAPVSPVSPGARAWWQWAPRALVCSPARILAASRLPDSSETKSGNRGESREEPPPPPLIWGWLEERCALGDDYRAFLEADSAHAACDGAVRTLAGSLERGFSEVLCEWVAAVRDARLGLVLESVADTLPLGCGGSPRLATNAPVVPSLVFTWRKDISNGHGSADSSPSSFAGFSR